MSDLVERLRSYGPNTLEWKAAIEIEQLEAALEDAIETLEAMDFHVDNPLYERLRAALSRK